ncbi:MAG: hypothetical protein A2V67_20570 [Deltaproteobacteria bacterium RBG_13_61_14]|nr:MAG: hypothetical protein A2V67_20570 [Deltaproteobacteria bacterium RBG_13_61_14]
MEETIILALAGLAALIVLTFPIHLIVLIIRKIKSRRNPPQQRPASSPVITHFVIASIIFLAAIAIPNFLKFKVRSAKSPQSEAKTNLGAIYMAQLSYFSDHLTYAGGSDTFKLINWEPAGQNRYAYYCQGAMIPNKNTRYLKEPPLPGRNWPVDQVPATSDTGFTCMAVGNIDNDDTLDVWSINDSKILRNDLNDI